MATTVRRAADITVGLPREQALALFTPEGERRWAEGPRPEGIRYARVAHGMTTLERP